MPDKAKVVKKHRICENCLFYLGLYDKKPTVSICENYQFEKVIEIFMEYNLVSIVKDAFENRKLRKLITSHNETKIEKGYITDITSGKCYLNLTRECNLTDLGVVLLWNTDGLPIANSSNGEVWLLQVQIINILPECRNNFQFVTGIHYRREKKPNMTSFLRPFVDSLIECYENGFQWQDEQKNNHGSRILAPIATLDAPARASVQNIMLFNGEYGCSLCEHPGQVVQTGSGHTRVYPFLADTPILRTNERMIQQAREAIENNTKHSKGVKNISVCSLIPKFNAAVAFVPDYMHAIIIGILKMLILLWISSKYKDQQFYMKKEYRDQTDKELKNIFPPDYVTRTPSKLKDIHYWKASQLYEALLHYFPILLIGNIEKKYYKHFLLLVKATTILLKSRILLKSMEKLYGLMKCSWNVHQLNNMVNCVRLWGPLYGWSAFPFEDGNGVVKRLTHGSNRIEIEISNAMYIFNANRVLRHQLCEIDSYESEKVVALLGKKLLEISMTMNYKQFYLSSIRNKSKSIGPFKRTQELK